MYRFSMVGKLQHFLQTQCNDAVMMVSSMDASPKTPLTYDAHRSKVKSQSETLTRLLGGSYTDKSEQLQGMKIQWQTIMVILTGLLRNQESCQQSTLAPELEVHSRGWSLAH